MVVGGGGFVGMVVEVALPQDARKNIATIAMIFLRLTRCPP
jgi:hypothetical protein